MDLFEKINYKCGKKVLQSVTYITEWDRMHYKVWQKVITKCDRYYKVRQNSFQSVTGITKWDRIHFKVWQVLQSESKSYYKVWQVLQRVTVITKWDVTPCNDVLFSKAAGLQLCHKEGAPVGVFGRISLNFPELPFYGTPINDCFCL